MLHHLSREWGETGWWFPGFSFLPFWDWGDICFLPVLRHLSQSPQPLKDLTKAHGFVDARFACVISNPVLLDQGEVFLPQPCTLLSWVRAPRGLTLLGGLMQRRCSVALPSLHSICLFLVNSTAWLQRKVTVPLLELHQFVTSLVSIWREQATILRLLAFSETISGENFYLH